MKKRYLLTMFMIMLIVFMVGCNKGPKENTQGTNPDENNKVGDVVDLEENITLYYSDADAENLVKQTMVVRLDGKTLEEIIINKLKEKPNDENIFATIPQNVTILGVKVEDKIATVDVSSDGLYGGSSQEMFMINGIVMSLTELENIDKVQFLIDGVKAESLMGHYTIDEPFSRNDIKTPIVEQ